MNSLDFQNVAEVPKAYSLTVLRRLDLPQPQPSPVIPHGLDAVVVEKFMEMLKGFLSSRSTPVIDGQLS